MCIFKKRKPKEPAYTPVRYGNLTPIDIKSPEYRSASIYKIMPRPEEIPAEFINSPGHLKWEKIFNTWFYSGLGKSEFIPWEGVDVKLARAQVYACAHSWDACHENKELGCAYLMNEFFKDIVIKS